LLKAQQAPPVRVLVVDDSVFYQKTMARLISFMTLGEVRGIASSGSAALRELNANEYDLVLLDIHLPDFSGVETLKRIRTTHPKVRVVMISGVSDRQSAEVIEALNLGALDFIEKPVGKNPNESTKKLQNRLEPILRLVQSFLLMKIQTKAASATAGPPPPGAPLQRSTEVLPARRAFSAGTGSFDLVAIGISTGGPMALSRLLPILPGNFPLPIVIVQHMPPLFTAALAKDLDQKSKLQVKEADEYDILEPGLVLIAPGGKHTVISRSGQSRIIKYDDGPPENGCRPSVDVLFRSIAHTGANTLAVIMTGMGSDGKKGVELLKRGHCHCLTQSAATCAVYGMPQAVDLAGLSDESVDLDRLPSYLIRLVGT
jgi:two-component system chemotaxis response regulator CheB